MVTNMSSIQSPKSNFCRAKLQCALALFKEYDEEIASRGRPRKVYLDNFSTCVAASK